ncbi:hypothetical protein KHS38_05815 [Mucilaginibacter sp. Bleaf8]|uniref:hypothetical protein n=1 Tax=Mucilaginibacter sp. Bleaf8 TaxID=2834430 RepID=UPI001BCD104C|nr:hypothetical protein [Mucilaginibacter sp. Bleaf8]MBS7563915.1 hypothetical protein [Mucilaginibacter sp. Bleaf8]
MKQQEIFKKIGTILKELNEQYDYLQSQEPAFNDLELELFAANAHFLTEHTEILRKLSQPVAAAAKPVSLFDAPPMQHEPAAERVIHHHDNLPVDEDIAESFAAPLPQLAESDVVYDPVEIPAEPVSVKEEELAPVVDIEPEPEPTAIIQEEPIITQVAETVVEPSPEPQVSIEPVQQDFYSFTRQEPEVSSSRHDFSISSHSEETSIAEPVPPVYMPAEEPKAEPTFVAPEPVVEAPEPAPVKEEALQPEPFKPEPVASQPTPVAEQPVVPNLFTQSHPQPAAEEPVLTLNQRLSAQLQGNNTASALHGQPITDLKSAISLNDKLLFVKDLFNGYSLAYSEAIELVNRCKTFEEADRFLKVNYVTKNNWEGKPTTVQKLYTLLHKRFQ